MNIPKELLVRIEKYEYDPEDEIDEMPLAYITYKDEEGKIRREGSWSKWGDEQLPKPIPNIPREGFSIAGLTQRSSDWFGSGRTMFYVNHPEGFSFEITSDNLFSLMSYCDIIGGVLQGKLILVWDGGNISLIPEDSDDYVKYSIQTKIATSGQVAMKDLVPGRVYSNREGTDKYVYIGQFYFISSRAEYYTKEGVITHVPFYKYSSGPFGKSPNEHHTPFLGMYIDKLHLFRTYYGPDDNWETKFYHTCKSKKVYDTGVNVVETLDEFNEYNDKQDIKHSIGSSRLRVIKAFAEKPTAAILKQYMTIDTPEYNELLKNGRRYVYNFPIEKPPVYIADIKTWKVKF